ncbi:hypothetical protein ACRRTK_013836 [Alexandromys fortis]
MESTNTKLWPLRLTLEVADWFILFSFILEILLMWISGFTLFWKNAWNVFDFVVTMLSMTFLLMLLLIFFYIFAVTGVYFFQDYSRSTIENLEYNMFFSDLLNSLVTVFILFTLDHWYAVLQDVWKVPEASRVFSSIYVILWLLLGSIIFRNIIVAMMVTNFQNIRNELSEEMTHLEVQYKADIFKRQIIQRRQNLSRGSVRLSNNNMDDRGTSQGKPSEDLLGHSKESVASDPGKNDANKSEDVNKSEDAKKSDDAENSDDTESSDDVDKSDDAEISDDVDESDEVGKVQKKPPKAKVFSSSSSDASSSYSSSLADLDHVGNLDWETLVHENLPGLMDMDQDDRVVWPRDSLFRYFELLEKLQYNIEERKKLQEFAVQALMSFEDK